MITDLYTFFLLKAACACAITRCAWYVTAKRTNVTMSQLFFSCNENENEGWFIFIYLLIETMTKTVGMFFLISHRENTTICFQFQMNKLQKDYIKVWIYFLKLKNKHFFLPSLKTILCLWEWTRSTTLLHKIILFFTRFKKIIIK